MDQTFLIISKILKEKNQIINQPVGKEILIELCKRFIYFIHDFKNLFKVKCSMCGKNAKYSKENKCFFPPYYKIYLDRDIIHYINNVEGSPVNLFYHKECFKKLDYH